MPKRPLCTSTVTAFPTAARSKTFKATLKFSILRPGLHEETVRLYWVDLPRKTAFRITVVLTSFGEDLSRQPFRKSRIASSKRATLEETYRMRQVFTFSFSRFSTKLNTRTTGSRKMHNMTAIGRRALTGG